MIMRGAAAEALHELSEQYSDGADPLAVLRDLAEITHWISVIKITPEAADDPTLAPDERTRGVDMASRLPLRSLSRMWQLLLKALEEVAQAPNAMMAAEMAVIRLTHVADLPDPETLLRHLRQVQPTGGVPGGAPAGGGAVHAPMMRLAPSMPMRGPMMQGGMQGGQALALQTAPETQYQTFDQVVALIRDKRDMKLLFEVESTLRLARYSPGRIEFEPTADAAPDFAARLGQRLQSWTGTRWGVSVVSSGGAPTITEEQNRELTEAKAEAMTQPLVQAILAAFPKAQITAIRTPEALAASAAAEALPEVEDEWDPFEES
jgi:DNA polymerase-3 subunit gamma/tau